MVYILALARLIALNFSTWFRFVVDGAGNDGSVKNTSNDGTTPLCPAVSFVTFMAVRGFELLLRLGFVPLMTLNILRVGDDTFMLVL